MSLDDQISLSIKLERMQIKMLYIQSMYKKNNFVFYDKSIQLF